jgi:hypothetical protein
MASTIPPTTPCSDQTALDEAVEWWSIEQLKW